MIVHLYEEYGERRSSGCGGCSPSPSTTGRPGGSSLARDRLGIKPLHCAGSGTDGSTLASELKSLRASPALSLTLDEVALDQYFSLLYVPAPRTIFREVKKLPPGHILIKDPGQPARRSVATGGCTREPIAARTEAEWIAGLRRGLDDAVASHLGRRRAPGRLPVGGRRLERDRRGHGAGGAGRIKTFSIGFPAEYAAFDERPYARQVAARFGTDHEEMEVEPGHRRGDAGAGDDLRRADGRLGRRPQPAASAGWRGGT